MNLARRVVVASAVTFGLGMLLSLIVQIGPVADVDRSATVWLHERAVGDEAVSALALDVTTIGDPITLTAFVAITVGWLVFNRHTRSAVWLVVVTTVASVVESMLKIVVGRARPDLDSVFLEPLSKSFPSGHATNTTVVLGAITVALVASATPRRPGAVLAAAILAAAVAFVVGLTRPVLGVHFVTDIVAGWTLGVVWLVLVRPHRSFGVEDGAGTESPT